MRNIITLETAQVLFSPYYPALSQAVEEGFDKYFETFFVQSNLGTSSHARTQASVLHDCVITKITEKFNHVEGINILQANGNKTFFSINFNGLAIGRVKKLNSGLMPSNIPTKQTKRFNSQYTIDGIPDLPTLLHIGYTLNETQTSLSGVYIVCIQNKSVEWYIDVTHQLSMEQTHLAFVDTNTELEAPIVPRVRIKSDIASPNIQTGS